MELTKENQCNNLGELIDIYQRPIQLQYLAFEDLFKFQKKLMPKNVWQSYIKTCEKFFINDLKRLFEELKR